MEMIFGNLLSNAVKYNREGGSVEINLPRRGPQVAVSVADTGIGMTPEEMSRIFGEFVRIKNESTAHIEGSGLGLSIVRKLAQLYGGEVRVESAPAPARNSPSFWTPGPDAKRQSSGRVALPACATLGQWCLTFAATRRRAAPHRCHRLARWCLTLLATRRLLLRTDATGLPGCRSRSPLPADARRRGATRCEPRCDRSAIPRRVVHLE